MSRPPGLYAIADARRLGGEPARFARAVVAMARGGVGLVQLRLKPDHPDLASDDGLRHAQIEAVLDELSREGLENKVQLWLDDRADLAACFPDSFAGVHVGQSDLPPAAVRNVLSRGAERIGRSGRTLIGLSCHDARQARAAEADPDVDWVAIGPVFGTGSKPDPDPVVGLDGVRAARQATSKPLVAIGGLDVQCVPAVFAAGCDAVVVLSALAREGTAPREIEAAARRLVSVAQGAASG